MPFFLARWLYGEPLAGRDDEHANLEIAHPIVMPASSARGTFKRRTLHHAQSIGPYLAIPDPLFRKGAASLFAKGSPKRAVANFIPACFGGMDRQVGERLSVFS